MNTQTAVRIHLYWAKCLNSPSRSSYTSPGGHAAGAGISHPWKDCRATTLALHTFQKAESRWSWTWMTQASPARWNQNACTFFQIFHASCQAQVKRENGSVLGRNVLFVGLWTFGPRPDLKGSCWTNKNQGNRSLLSIAGDNICLKCSILWRNENSLIDQARKKTSRVTTSN